MIWLEESETGMLIVHFSPDEARQLMDMLDSGGASDNLASRDFYKLLQEYLDPE